MKAAFLASVALLLAVTTMVDAWAKPYRSDKYWKTRNSKKCTTSGGKCYASEQCCDGYVCAAFNDNDGSSPNIPGYCVKEKELTPCNDDVDCLAEGLSCSVLEGTKERYCMQKPHPKRKGYFEILSYKGGLGSTCTDNNDCNPTASDGSPLCCQVVRGHRQRKKKMCDRVSSISRCVKSPNAIGK